MAKQKVDEIPSGLHARMPKSLSDAASRGQGYRDISQHHDSGLLDEMLDADVQGDLHTPVPATKSASDFLWDPTQDQSGPSADDPLATEADGDGQYAQREPQLACEEDEGMPRLSSSDVKMRVNALLNLGYTPHKVQAYLVKLAEQMSFDRELSNDYLKTQAGVLGYAYLEPNHYMNSCTASYKKVQREGKLRAASVKQITACTGCTHYQKLAGVGKRCKLYKLPIVATSGDLDQVVTSLIGPMTASSRKAALVARANGEPLPGHQTQHTNRLASGAQNPTKAARTASAQAERSAIPVRTRWDAQAHREASNPLPAKRIKAALDQGTSLVSIFAAAKAKLGSAQARKSVTAFIHSLKGTGARINLASLDCGFLPRRLTASETIVGASKCAGCTHRNGMSCSLTGGTLLSFPGMERTGRRASSEETETNPMEELGLGSAPDPLVIEPKERGQVDEVILDAQPQLYLD